MRWAVQGPDHAIRAGMVWGAAMAAGLALNPIVDDEGNYLAAMELVLPAEGNAFAVEIRVILVVEPPVVAS